MSAGFSGRNQRHCRENYRFWDWPNGLEIYLRLSTMPCEFPKVYVIIPSHLNVRDEQTNPKFAPFT